MAIVTQPYLDNHVDGSATNSWKKTWTVSYAQTDIVASGSSFTYTTPALTAKFTGTTGGKYRTVNFEIDDIKIGNKWIGDYYNPSTGSYPFHPDGTSYIGIWRMSEPRAAYAGYGISGTSGSTFSVTKRITDVDNRYYTYVHSGSCRTSDFFDESNNTEQKLDITIKFDAHGIYLETRDGASTYNGSTYYDNGSALSYVVGSVTLNAPPTYTATLSPGGYTADYYTGVTTLSATMTDASAQYEGDITEMAFTFGNKTITAENPSTYSHTATIHLNEVGTFTPTVVVTDSRGQTTTKTFPNITVKEYNAPSVSFDIYRSNSNGVKDDEGEYALVKAKLTYMQGVSNLTAPTVTVKDEHNNNVPVTATWYTDYNEQTGVSTAVNWNNVSSGDTVYCKLAVSDGLFSKTSSYKVTIQETDSLGESSFYVDGTLSTAYYTIDFQAGGKEIAFGASANDDVSSHSNGLFKCDMDMQMNGDLVVDGEAKFNDQVEFDGAIVGGVAGVTINGDTYVTGTLECTEGIYGSNVGAREYANGDSETSNVTQAADSYVTIGSVTLTGGLWIVCCRARFVPNASGNNYPAIYVTTNSAGTGWHQRTFTQGTTNAQMSVTVVMNITDISKPVYLRGYSNTAGYWNRQNSAQFSIEAVRIK